MSKVDILNHFQSQKKFKKHTKRTKKEAKSVNIDIEKSRCSNITTYSTSKRKVFKMIQLEDKSVFIRKKPKKVQELIEPKNELLKVNPYGTFNVKKFYFNKLLKPSAIISLNFYALSNVERVKRSDIQVHLDDYKVKITFFDFLLPYKINSINPQLSQSILFDLHRDFEDLKQLLKGKDFIFGGGWFKDKKNHKKYLELTDYVYSK